MYSLHNCSNEALIAELSRRLRCDIDQQKINTSTQIKSGYTLGGKNKLFEYQISSMNLIIDRVEAKIRDVFSMTELLLILNDLHGYFGAEYFPLANNLAKISKGTEINGFGKVIFDITKNITKSQASSQLSVIFIGCGLMEWNGTKKGIKLHLVLEKFPRNEQELLELLK